MGQVLSLAEPLLKYVVDLIEFHCRLRIDDALSNSFSEDLVLCHEYHSVVIYAAVYYDLVSNAFDKSRYMLIGVSPLSKCCNILSITSNIACSVE